METKFRLLIGEEVSRFETHCPRCGETAIVIKTTTHFITRCTSCGFDMGQLRDPEFGGGQ